MSKLRSRKSIKHSYIRYDHFCEDNLFDFQVLCLPRPSSTHFKLAVIVNQQNRAKVVRLVSEQKSGGLVRVKCLSPPTTVSGICRMVPPPLPSPQRWSLFMQIWPAPLVNRHSGSVEPRECGNCAFWDESSWSTTISYWSFRTLLPRGLPYG